MHNSSLVQIYPSRISITPQRAKLTCQSMVDTLTQKRLKLEHVQRYKSNFNAVKNPFIISKASKRKIFDSVNSMFCLSDARTVHMQNGKPLYNFKLAFVTLTLPSQQAHDDVTIKKELLNQFLVELRKNYGIQNYIWKAELQQNENIHFHLILDKYVDFQALRRRWNRCCNKLGYVDAYSNKMSSMSLSDYHALRNKNLKCDFQKSALSYANGNRCNWSNPNSVDVRSVQSKKDLAIYLSKYIAKSDDNADVSDEMLVRQLAFGRCWSRSYSLSKLKYRNKLLVGEVLNLIEYLKSEVKKVHKVTGDFFTVFFFNALELSPPFQKFHYLMMKSNAKLYNYPFP